MDFSKLLNRNFIIGVLLQIVTFAGYPIVSGYFYYGGGFPVVQVIFCVVFIFGTRYIFRSPVPRWLKYFLCFWWVGWIAWNIAAAVISGT